MQIFIIFLTIGIMLVAAEVFLPGGIMGIIGGLALLAAIITAFTVFGAAYGAYVALGVIVFSAIAIAIWIKFFPRTRIGKALTLSSDEATYKSADAAASELIGQSGRAVTDLRPAGLARIAGRNYDVISEGPLIKRGAEIQVARAEGNRIVVRKQ